MPKTRPVPLSKEEVDKIIAAASDDDFYYMLFMTAKTTGRRLGEYWTIKVKHVDLDKRIMVTRILKRRQYVLKQAILTDEIVRLMRRYIAQNHLKLEDYLFRAVSYRQIQNAVKSYAKKAGIEKNVMFHNFRHYFITSLAREGWPYEKIMKLTGHGKRETLVIYDHTVAKDIEEDARETLKNI